MWEAYQNIIPHISVGSGIIKTVPDWVLSQGYRTLLAVTDPNTRRVAGDRVISVLREAGVTVRESRFEQNEPLPDETSIGTLLASYSTDIDLILGIGSGVINDLCTFVGAKVRCPSAIVGTAPSMDGYASLGSAMLLGGLKITPPTQCPVAIFCDIDILKESPSLMIASGLGDMLGKYSALADWRLSHLLTGEPMPEEIVSLVENALQKCAAGASKAASRDPEVIQSITEGLILSGIAMSLYGDSRPASGTEHHLAHYWEMRYCMEEKTPIPHGIKVGLAAICALAMWKELLTIQPESYSNHPENHADKIRELYGASSEEILNVANPVIAVDDISEKWESILQIASSIPAPEALAALLADAGAPVRPSEIGLDEATLRDSVIYARDRKKTFTLLQLLGNLGRLEDFAGRAVQYFEKSALSGVKCFVLDMDGTIYLGDKLFPFTPDFLSRVKEAGRDFLFFTNNSSQSVPHYISKLKSMGISVQTEKMLMSTQVLLSHLKENVPGEKVFVAGTRALIDDFVGAGYTVTQETPDFAVLGFDRDMDYVRLTVLCDLVRSGVPVYGVNMDYNCPIEGGYIPDCGSLAAAVKASTGVDMEFYGKPSRRALDFIISKTGYREEELCFVGDRLYTDIAIASSTRARSVLVLSGETRRSDLRGSAIVPDLVVKDLSELAVWL